jgi:hypothetical protein
MPPPNRFKVRRLRPALPSQQVVQRRRQREHRKYRSLLLQNKKLTKNSRASGGIFEKTP